MTTKLDWRREMAPAEWDRIAANYRELLGETGYGHFEFVPFMAQLQPEALMRYRLWVDVVTNGVGFANGLPNPPYISLIIGHFYTVLRYPAGIYGDLAVARTGGATKTEVADIIKLAWLHSGPFGVNTVAQVARDFFADWTSDAGSSGMTWPANWIVQPDAFECGVDFESPAGSNDLPAGEISKIEEWHERVEGEVPAHVRFLAKEFPLALRAYRARVETSTRGTLPPQMIALCRLHLAASWGQSDAGRRALHMCRHFQVEREHVIQVLTLSQLYLGDTGMDAAIAGVEAELAKY